MGREEGTEEEREKVVCHCHHGYRVAEFSQLPEQLNLRNESVSLKSLFTPKSFLDLQITLSSPDRKDPLPFLGPMTS